jgi:hypothetical protein
MFLWPEPPELHLAYIAIFGKMGGCDIPHPVAFFCKELQGEWGLFYGGSTCNALSINLAFGNDINVDEDPLTTGVEGCGSGIQADPARAHGETVIRLRKCGARKRSRYGNGDEQNHKVDRANCEWLKGFKKDSH